METQKRQMTCSETSAPLTGIYLSVVNLAVRAFRIIFAEIRYLHCDQDSGPNLYGMFGRKAGAQPRYDYYSEVMKASPIIWIDTTVDAFLRNPQTFMPGSRMPFAGIADAEQRLVLIAYLKMETGGLR